MHNIRVVIVEPKYQINLGYIARVARNFGVDRLYLVNPRCKCTGKEALKYSKHARGLLTSARICSSIKSATKGMQIVIGTTGLPFKTDKGMYNFYPSQKLPKLLKGKKSAALLIGRDDTGLTKEELAECDAVVVVPTDPVYPVLNISHALAIMLYEICGSRNVKAGNDHLDAKRKSLIRLFSMNIKMMSGIHDKKSVARAFEHIINRADPSKKEINTLSAAFSLNKRAEKR